MNKTQLQTTLAPVVGVVAAYLATRYPLLDAATWNSLVTSMAFAGVALFTGYVTRKTSLTDTVGNLPGTTVVTDKATADALPANSSVVANTEVKVVPK